MGSQVQLEENPFRKLLCVGEKLSSDTQSGCLEDFSEDSWAFAVVSGCARNGTNGSVPFLF